MPSRFDLSGRVAIVTGGSGLLGSQYCDALAEAGACVVQTDLPTVVSEAVASEIGQRHGVEVIAWGVDVSDPDSVEAMVRRVVDEFGRVDVLVNNAALTVKAGPHATRGYFTSVEEYPLDAWEQALKVTLTGTFLCAQAAGRQMVKQGGGTIINVCSTYGLVGPDFRIYGGALSPYERTVAFNTPPSYATAKGAILALTRYLATYWAKDKIRVNCLTPGGVFDGHDEDFVREYAFRTPLGRMANRDEYRGAIVFLASDASSYMTGSNLVIDGGWTAW